MYVPLDVNFPDDDKIESVSNAAAGLYCKALCLAKRLETDGRLHRRKLHKLGADDDLIDECVRVDLFRTDADTIWITAWLNHNESAEEIAERRAADANRKRRTRKKQGPASTSRPSGRSSDVRSESSDAGSRNPPLEVEKEIDVETEVEKDSPKLYRPAFERFNQAYPRRAKKAEAARAYERARKIIGDEELIRAAERYAAAYAASGRNPDFIPYPASWLNSHCWADDLPQPEHGGKSQSSARTDRVLEQFIRDSEGTP
jgi:hypothetical protein